MVLLHDQLEPGRIVSYLNGKSCTPQRAAALTWEKGEHTIDGTSFYDINPSYQLLHIDKLKLMSDKQQWQCLGHTIWYYNLAHLPMKLTVDAITSCRFKHIVDVYIASLALHAQRIRYVRLMDFTLKVIDHMLQVDNLIYQSMVLS
jgi:hypothetical protein